MNNLVILPILLPLLTGILMFFIPRQIRLQQAMAVAGALITLGTSLLIVSSISDNGIQILNMGGWEAPFGITLVADMLAGLLVTTASIVTLVCLLYAFYATNQEQKKFYVYPLIMILLCGVNGSFLTGDIFNLFVFFEVMLISSYALISLGGGKIQLRETIKYVVTNIISSMLFVIAIAYLYSITGTLNMAHLSERVALAGQDGLITTVSLLFLIVFGLKAALLLFFWLPGSYSAPPAAIAALFAALLTKVGIYAIMRMFTLIFYHQSELTHTILVWMSALTMVLGAVGAIAYSDIRRILAYNVIVSVGFIVFGVAVASEAALSGSVFYLIHDMLAKALIFILGGAIISIAGTDKLREIPGLIRFRPTLGWLFFLSVLALAGVPPLSGFVGKVMILQGGVDQRYYVMAAVGILTSLLVMYSAMKIFINSFWGETLLSEGEEKSSGKGYLLPGSILAALLIGLGLGAEPMMEYVGQAVEVMLNPTLYIEAVLP
ncbi:Na+/H+ antiporter subunit D [Paenibacillus sp. GCM10012307]|uniref:Na+/H+ antiporter subunit D n=1 Tax=Paenibacillus roseus TaxID=2798579 RepID=A0A934MN39_9BACL|nr:Na+/H+ antiporter subunit D [Paenibacillus roseus]MBJ6360596.1 Na+/H+ antiporter subunit D [Paenibacillus roseus]